MRIIICRGQPFRGGSDDFVIAFGGVEVFPRLVAAEHRKRLPATVHRSGINELDQLLGGGIASGSSTLII